MATLRIGGETRSIQVESRTGDLLKVRLGDTVVEVRVLAQQGHAFEVALADGRRLRFFAAQDRRGVFLHLQGDSYAATHEDERPGRLAHGGHEPGLEAPMPGQVRAVAAEAGAAVLKGDTLVVLEAMKMELRVRAPHDGTVARVLCKVGDTVERGQLLVELA